MSLEIKRSFARVLKKQSPYNQLGALKKRRIRTGILRWTLKLCFHLSIPENFVQTKKLRRLFHV